MPGLPSVDEALAIVLSHVAPPAPSDGPVAWRVGDVLAEEIRADHDHPPFPRSRVDGWAVRSADLTAGTALRVAVTIAAGTAPGSRIGPGEAARIFTGAPVPDGADAVAMQERCEPSSDGVNVRVPQAAATADNVVPRGAECREGDVVARPGAVVGPGLVGALASAGASSGRVFRAPRVRVVSTGDELVPCGERPGPGKIRNSNAPAIEAAAGACGGVTDGSRWAPDDDAALRTALAWALEADVALVTGGVSVGDFDLVPRVLESLGVARALHGVKVQPGKPLWFGTRGRTLVFGLPGNPVSALVNVALFVRPAIERLCGLALGSASFPATLEGPVGGGTWRRKYVPALVRREGAVFLAAPLPFQGSGDVFGFSRANALVVVPEESTPRGAGATVDCVPLFEAIR